MSDAEIAARLIEALNDAAGADAALVSVEITMLAAGEVARVEAHATRKTRTLAFLSAECWNVGGERVATATSVHRISSGEAP